MRIDKSQGDLLSQRWKATTKGKETLLEQLATGKRINRASDDASGMAQARDFEKQIRAYRVASDNISAGLSALSIADGGASTITDMLQRQRELAVQGANGALNDDERGALDKEFQSLSQEIDRISKSTDFNGQNLLSGQSKLSDGTGKIRTGDSDDNSVTLSSADLSVSGLALTSEQIGSSDGALKALSALDSAMRKVNDQRSTTGGVQNRLDFASSNIDTQLIQSVHGLENVEDLDFAKALSQKVKDDVLQNTTGGAIAQFNQLSRTHLLALLQ